ncbi:MAG: EAL domain-containing protein [Brotaphodocola sp.]
MTFNIDFLVAGLICLTFVLYHFAIQNRLVDTSSRIFTGFIVIGLLDITFDIVSSLLISMEDPNLEQIVKMSLTIFYVMQVCLPYGMFLYMRSLWDRNLSIKRGMIGMTVIPPVVMSLLVLFNYWSEMFFWVRGAVYGEGPYYAAVYIHALIYMGITLFSSIIHKKFLGKDRLAAICEVIMVITVCVVIQFVWRTPLLIGFGISLGISVFFFTINNPKEYMDNMTAVFDNRYFSVVVQNLIERKKRFHLVTVDFYLLKKINMIYGNQIGNQIIVDSAKRIHSFSETGQVFRIHGNRFAVITYSLTEYEQILNQVEESFNGAMEVSGQQISFPVIICGITEASKLGKPDALLSYIEYLASLPNRNGDTIFIQDDDRIMEGFCYANEIEAYLQTAIDEDLFEVFYQPVYSMESGTYITLEALSRLTHPSLGQLSPEVFISIAEKNGQIAQIGYLQFSRVCRFLKKHPELMKQIRNVKFNLSPAELMTKGHCERLIETIGQYGLPYSWFQFEITETVATEYSSSLYEIGHKLLEAGIGLCLDDFGSGFANFNTVLKLPFRSIKLDRSLLVGIEEDPKSSLFYQNIVSVLQNMGYSVIAEGVETKNEMELLTGWGVDMIQGYYFSKPVGEKKILDIVLNRKTEYNGLR